jgi:hypothetical protein
MVAISLLTGMRPRMSFLFGYAPRASLARSHSTRNETAWYKQDMGRLLAALAVTIALGLLSRLQPVGWYPYDKSLPLQEIICFLRAM